MKTEAMVEKMYNKTLNAAELGSIGKNRGIPRRELSSTTLFETVFLSDKGLGSSFRSLDQKEIALLHLLKLADKDVDVSFFEPVYGDIEKIGKWSYYDSFSKRYREVLKNVRRSLVRKGVIIFAESDEYWSNETKMERLKFRFPREFHDLLPSPFSSLKRIKRSAHVKNKIARESVKRVIDVEHGAISGESGKFNVTIKNGRLAICGKRFQNKLIRKWQLESWKRGAMSNLKKIETIGSPFDVLQYAFSTLKKDEWIEPDDLSVFWDILYPEKGKPDNSRICEKGMKGGCLARCKFKGKVYCRPSEIEEEGDVRPKNYILTGEGGSLNIDLDLIPFTDLEVLADISRMEVRDSKLTVSPDIVSIGKHYREIRDHPLTIWLEENSDVFGRALKDVDGRWGKCIIHKDIMMARVTDLSLRVKLQKTFKGKKGIHPLDGDFIAFPAALLPDISRSVERAGFVVRMNGSDEENVRKGG